MEELTDKKFGKLLGKKLKRAYNNITFNYKIKYLILKFTSINWIRRNLHCRFGYHKVKSGSCSKNGTDIRKIKSDYIECVVCNKLWFTDKKNKQNYLKIQETKIDWMYNYFKNLKINKKWMKEKKNNKKKS